MTTSATVAATEALSRPATENAADGSDPSIPSAAYERMKPRWEKCRACFIGTEAIRAGGTDFLAQYDGETDEAYQVRKVLAAFYNAFKRTALASVGMLLEEEPTLGDDMPDELVELAENIDFRGTHLNVFASRLATAGIVDGYAGIMVEHSKSVDAAAKKLSGDEEARLGLRPYFLLFKADDVIKPIYATINGVRTLVLLILREVVSERVGLFGTKTVTQYRVYTNEAGVVRYQLWKSPDQGGGRPTLSEGPTTITNQTEIPWSPLIAGEEIAQDEWMPPLMDLADLNIQYHNSLTNHLSLEALAYVPTPVRVGAIADANGDYPEITLGPRNTIEAPQMQGVAQPIYWLSPPVDVLEAGARTLEATKADMGTLGAAFLSAETRAAETAEGKRIDSAASRATLKKVSGAAKDCLERAFGFMAAYRGLTAGSVTLNDNFTGEGIDPTYLGVLVQAYHEDILTLEELRHVIQTGQLPEDFDPSDKAIIDELFARAAAREDAKELQDAARIGGPPPGAGSGGNPPTDLEIVRDANGRAQKLVRASASS